MRKFYWKDLFAKNDPEKFTRAIQSALTGGEIFAATDDSRGYDKGDSLFNAAVCWGNAETVKACIAKREENSDCRGIEEEREHLRDTLSSALWDAVSARNADTLKALLDAGADVKELGEAEWDLRANLFPEAETGNPSPEALEYKRYLDSGEEILKMLKEHGAKVPYDLRTKMKPTFIGAHSGWREYYCLPDGVHDIKALWGAVSPEALKLRIASGADVNGRDREKWTALHYITYGDYFDRDTMIEVLLSAGARIDARGSLDSDITPLMLAAGRIRQDAAYLETVKLLIKNGANLKAKTKEGQTALWWATDWWNFKVEGEAPMLLEIIGELGRAFGRSRKKRTSARREIDVDLMTAAFWASPEKLAEILPRGADVNVRSENGYTPLMFASIYNHAATVKFLIEAGADPNARNVNGDTPLLLAVRTHDAGVIKALIEGGADPRAEDARGTLPLEHLPRGIVKSSYEAVHILLDAMGEERGEDNARDSENDEEADEDENEAGAISEEEQNFLRHGLSFEKDTRYMSFVLSYDSLFRLNDGESLVRAVKNGLNIALDTDDGWGFFEAAINNNATGVLRACIEMGADVNHSRGHGGEHHWSNMTNGTPLGAAVTRGNLDAVEILVENGLDAGSVERVRFAFRKNDFPEGCDKSDKRARKFKRILDRNAKILRLLRDAGFDIPGEGLEMTFTGIDAYHEHFIGNGDVLALVRAVSPLALEKAIDSGINVNARDKSPRGFRRAALHYLAESERIEAYYYNRHEMIKLMLASGADVNVPDAGGWTPLKHILCWPGDEIMLDLLTAAIASGADFEKKTKKWGGGKKPALDILRDHDSRSKDEHDIRLSDEFCGEIERAFGRKSNADERARANVCLMMAARWGNAAQVKRALADADVDAGSSSGFTPLMFAAFYNEPDAVKRIIDAGADLEARNAAGETALIVATGADWRISNIETLISAGADANAADNEGYTALMRLCGRARGWSSENYVKNIRALVDAGADVNARNAEGRAALMIAANEYDGETEIFEILVGAGADVNARDNLGRTALGFARKNSKFDIERFLVSAGARKDETGPDENYFPDAALKLRDCGVEL